MITLKKLQQIDEAFQNFVYKTPDDPELILYDFYFMAIIARHADLSREPDVEWIVKDSVEKIVESLYVHMNRALKWSLTCEMRHIFDSVFKPNSSGAQAVFKKYPKFTIEFFNNLTKLKTKQSLPSYLSSISDIKTFVSELASRFEQDPMVYVGNHKEREIANEAVKLTQKRLNISNYELAIIYEDFYDSDSWGSSGYGGKNWARIAVGWQKLLKARKINDKIIWIDHAYDLQHNTDTVFNKIKAYYKGGYSWIGNALDWKRDIKDPRQFYYRVSAQLKPIVAYIAKNHYGTTIADFKGNEKPKPKPKAAAPAGYDYGTTVSGASSNFNQLFKAELAPQGAAYGLTPQALALMNWDPQGKVGITQYLANEIYAFDDIYNHPLIISIVNFSSLVSIADTSQPIVFGSKTGEKPSLKKGAFKIKPGVTSEMVNALLQKFHVDYNKVSLLHSNSEPGVLPPAEVNDDAIASTDVPSWVAIAAQGSSIFKVTPMGPNTGFKIHSWDLEDWGITHQEALQWKNYNVWVSQAIVNFYNHKYSKIKWIFKLRLENVYVHYNREKDEAEIIGEGIGKSAVIGFWKKGNLKYSNFAGTWNNGMFIHSLFVDGTWKKGTFSVESGSKWIMGTWEKGNWGDTGSIYANTKGFFPVSAKVSAAYSESFHKDDIYLQESSVETARRIRKGWD